MDEVQRRCEEFARRGQLVVMAGAGVSAGRPSAVPGWNALNEAVFRALRRRVESGVQKPGWLDEADKTVESARDAERFPPDYQAQLIEEMCGLRYFQGLQALDIETGNAAHEAIAALAAGGALRAIVTTNFDRLIERALERRGVTFTPAFDEAGFVAVRDGADGALPVIKVHGCVSSAGSMVDTWKQRRLGRSRVLTDLLAPLHDAFWIYAGFSADDLAEDHSYLGFIAGAGRSPGAIYIRFPGGKGPLRPGAEKLLAAYAERGEARTVDVAECLDGIGGAVGAPAATAIADDEPRGRAEIEGGLARWADGLTVSAAGLCVAAILEAIGAGEGAVRVLDRLARKDGLYDERDSPDFSALQLQYGRLGGALGRFIAVRDMAGNASNASVETVQSLLRVIDGDAGFLARAWLAPLLLWQGGRDTVAGAVEHAATIIGGFARGRWQGSQPRSDEEVVDAWTCAAQVLVFDANAETASALAGTSGMALGRARACGDVVREARVAAMHLLALAETREDVPALARSYDVFESARRVHDPVAFGHRALALGRWYVGAGGLALRAGDPRDPTVPLEALAALDEAAAYFGAVGMDPWVVFVEIQRAKAFADLGRLDESSECVNGLPAHLARFPVLESFFFEAVAQIQQAVGIDAAASNYDNAVETALESGLRLRHHRLAALVEAQRAG